MSWADGVTGYCAVTWPVAGSARTSEKYGGRTGMAPRAEHTPFTHTLPAPTASPTCFRQGSG